MKLRCVHFTFTTVILLIAYYCIPANAQTKQTTYKTYYNPRFEYSISYPVGILYPQEIAANGDGRKFLSKDNQTVMLVYGQENVQRQTLSQLYKEESREDSHTGKVVTYKMLKNNWFVVSGYEDGRVFYQKTIYRNDEFLTSRIEYPEAQKEVFDSITATIAKSFR